MDNLKMILEDHEKRIARLESLLKEKPPTIARKKESLGEFLLQRKPKDSVERTLFVVYYLEQSDGLSPVNVKDIEAGFRAAKEAVPDNINYNVIKNIQKGLMMEAGGKKDNRKAWNLTATGERYVEGRNIEG